MFVVLLFVVSLSFLPMELLFPINQHNDLHVSHMGSTGAPSTYCWMVTHFSFTPWSNSHLKHHWSTYWLPGIYKQVQDFVMTCDEYQKYKITEKWNYGKIPLKYVFCECKPWAIIHVYCCSPCAVKYHHKVAWQVIKQKIQLLTICDACTSWPEFAIMFNMITKNAAQQLDQACFCHYPCPEVIMYHNGTECTFPRTLESYGIKGKPTKVKNSQANLHVKYLCGPLGDQLHTMVFKGSDFYEDLDMMA